MHEIICWEMMTTTCRCPICLTSTQIPIKSMCKCIPFVCVSLQIQQYTLSGLLGQARMCPKTLILHFIYGVSSPFGQVAAQHQLSGIMRIDSCSFYATVSC